jgi:hypothetical protein
MAIEGKDYEDLKQAVVRLEFPSFISKITSYIETTGPHRKNNGQRV